jgi:hypothetical protein
VYRVLPESWSLCASLGSLRPSGLVWSDIHTASRGRGYLEACGRSGIGREQVAKEALSRYKLQIFEEKVDIFEAKSPCYDWLQKGDHNISFFHVSCRERRKK